MLSSILLAFSLIVGPQTEANAPPLCRPIANLPLDVPSGVEGISLQQGLYYSGEDSETYAEIRLINNFHRNIRLIGLVVEYTGEAGETLVTIAFHAVVGTQAWRENWKVHAEYENEEPNPIQPGQPIKLVGLAWSAVAACPTKARVTYVDLEFVDGSHFTSGAPDWSFPPTVRDTPYYAGTPPATDAADSCAKFVLNINRNGQYESMIPAEQAPPLITRYAATELGKWAFYPGLKNGNPVDSKISVLFCLNSLGQFHFMKPEQAQVPTTLIQLFAPANATNRWQMFWGWHPASPRHQVPE
jgi:hypothetical protein